MRMIKGRFIVFTFSVFIADFKTVAFRMNFFEQIRLRSAIVLWDSEASNVAATRMDGVRFMSPLLEYGYRPAVEEYENKSMNSKPILLYLPGFDGTFISPFLQFPELNTIFDIRCMTVAMQNRSTLEELRDSVINYLEAESFEGEYRRPIYLCGESFGGILAIEVMISLQSNESKLAMKGMVLINAATCYDRSELARYGPPLAKMQKFRYFFGLLNLLPLFADEHSMKQLALILQAKALPSVIDDACREAYMGRVAFSMPFVLPFMTQEALAWRLMAWLNTGCAHLGGKSEYIRKLGAIPTLIVAGEKDNTLPSLDEAERLKSLLPNAAVHVVKEAGHASTCGSRIDLAALFRLQYEELRVSTTERNAPDSDLEISRRSIKERTCMKKRAANGKGAFFGMEPRYDDAGIGLSPLRYWDKEFYKNWNP